MRRNQMITIALAAFAAATLGVQAAQSGSGKLQTLNRIIGSEVTTSDNQKVGKIDNVILDLESGHVLFALLDLNNTKERVALPPGVVASAQNNDVRLNITRDKVNNAPKIEGDLTRERVSQASFVHNVYQHFNQQFWWQGSTPADQGKFNNVQPGRQLIGMNVVNVQDKPIGDVRNALIDLPAGRILYVVLEPNKELGTKLYPLPPSALTLRRDGKTLVTDLDKEKMANAPSFAKNQPPSFNDRSFAARVYQHYGKQAYFETGSRSALSATGGQSQQIYQQEQNSNSSSKDKSSSDSNNEVF